MNVYMHYFSFQLHLNCCPLVHPGSSYPSRLCLPLRTHPKLQRNSASTIFARDYSYIEIGDTVKKLALSSSFLLLASIATFYGLEEITDVLSIGETIEFNGEEYTLVWSSHPTENYYKQEYLRSHEDLNEFHKMLLVESVRGDLDPKDAAKIKMSELEQIKHDNPVVNYDLITNDDLGEALLDFVISDQNYIYEWNAYRYQTQNVDGQDYLVLFGYCMRDSLNTNEELREFFGEVKKARRELIGKLAQAEIPRVNPR